MTTFSWLAEINCAHAFVLCAFILVGYIVKLERRLSKMGTDICWIKKAIGDKET